MTLPRLILMAVLAGCARPASGRDTVVLLHGLCRSSDSMTGMARALEAADFAVVNFDYASRAAPIEALAATVIPQALAKVPPAAGGRIHFVTHSLGGILVRCYLRRQRIPQLGRVVMLGPPNQGSEVVDALGDWPVFTWINGPAGHELGTGADAVPVRLGAVAFELGVVAGDRSINLINSWIIPGPDDGKVSVERTKVPGMKDHVVVHVPHPFLMNNREVIGLTIGFLQEGRFAGRAPR